VCGCKRGGGGGGWNTLTSCGPVSFSRRTLLNGVSKNIRLVRPNSKSKCSNYSKTLNRQKICLPCKCLSFKLCACLVAVDISMVDSTECMYKERRCVVCSVAHKPTYSGGGGRCPLV